MNPRGIGVFETFQEAGTRKEADDFMMHDEDYYVLALLVLSGAEEFSRLSQRNETDPLEISNSIHSYPETGHVSSRQEEKP